MFLLLLLRRLAVFGVETNLDILLVHFAIFLLDELSVRSKAIDLVDSVLEQSVQYLSSRLEQSHSVESDHQQPPRATQAVRFDDHPDQDEYDYVCHADNYFDQPPALNVNTGDTFLHSDSENFAITCDLSNGAEFLKSPTIESISGKSFDDNMSPQDDEHDLIGLDLHLPLETIAPASGQMISERLAAKIDRKFERLSSDFDDGEDEDCNGFGTTAAAAFAQTVVVALDGEDVSQLQNEFSKLSWDESQSTTTTVDPNLSTPDNDLQGPEGDLGGMP